MQLKLKRMKLVAEFKPHGKKRENCGEIYFFICPEEASVEMSFQTCDFLRTKSVQCSAIMMQSVFFKILPKDTP